MTGIAASPAVDPAHAESVPEIGSALAIPLGWANRYVAALRRQHSSATPGQVLYLMEKHFLLAMSVGGTGTGLLALRTGTTSRLLGLSAAHLGASGAISTLYLLGVARIYGLDSTATTHLLTRALGEFDEGILQQQWHGTWWRTALAYLPVSQVRFTQQIASRSLARAARRGSVARSAAALPAGIGGGLGFTSGRILGNRVVDAATSLLGEPPQGFAA